MRFYRIGEKSGLIFVKPHELGISSGGICQFGQKVRNYRLESDWNTGFLNPTYLTPSAIKSQFVSALATSVLWRSYTMSLEEHLVVRCSSGFRSGVCMNTSQLDGPTDSKRRSKNVC